MKGPISKFTVDIALWTAALILAFWFRVESQFFAYGKDILALLVIGLPAKALLIWYLGTYRRSWHRFSLRDLLQLGSGIAVYTAAFAIISLIPFSLAIPRSVPFIEGMIAVIFLCSARVAARLIFEERLHLENGGRKQSQRVLIVGAGEAGTMIAREMLRNPQAKRLPIGFVDDDLSKRRQRFVGLRVLGPISRLAAIVRLQRIDEVLIAMPSQSGDVVRRVVAQAQSVGAEYRIIPGMFELISGDVSISAIREVNLEDLLRRKAVRLEADNIAGYVTGKRILITGAGGSIGSEIVRQIARFEPSEVLLLGRGENSIYQINRELASRFPHLKRKAIIADVRDYATLEQVFRKHRPHVVFHAAAHKHVPLMEDNPEQAIFNNVGGTRNLTDLALAYEVERFVNVSTDKAVNPTSIMGASKRMAELVVSRASARASEGQAFMSVRFGNVLGSRGSVIPLFKDQISKGGPVTVTHPEMVRYFMTIPEAAQLVLQAGSQAENGNVYVLDMGEPVKIVDLATDLIRLSGLEPGVDVKIAFSGMRPGEKLFEELLTAEEGTYSSSHEKIFVARKQRMQSSQLDQLLNDLFDAAGRRDKATLYSTIDALVPSNDLEILRKQVAAA